MNDLMKFNYGEREVRTTILTDGEIWFYGSDACEILGILNPRDVYARLGEDDVDTIDGVDSLGRKTRNKIISEPGLYQLIFQSRKPEAQKFKKWITHEVLPQIRKTGRYEPDSEPNDAASAIAVYESNLNALKQLHSEISQNSKEIKQIKEAQARTATAEHYFTITGFANLNGYRSIDLNLGTSLGKRATRLCHERGYQIHSTPDPRWGRLNTYPKEILEIVFLNGR